MRIAPLEARARSFGLPAWARWNAGVHQPYTIGVEEEMMLLHPADLSLAQRSDELPDLLSGGLAERISPETHAAVVEYKTGVHADVLSVGRELETLRDWIALELGAADLAVAAAGTHPLASWRGNRASQADRYRVVAESMRGLAFGPPTMAMHVHVGVADPDDAVRLLNAFGRALPLLLALSANSPFLQGRDGGFASERTALMQRFPRTGPARQFGSYGEYVDAVDALITSGAVPDPTFLWWDVRLQPALGTVEVRVMDAQSTVADALPLIALIQSLARFTLERGSAGDEASAEVIAENRFLAARDGTRAQLIHPATGRLTAVQVMVESLLDKCRPHAAVLGCSAELEQVRLLASANGADRQRRWAGARGDLAAVVLKLTERFGLSSY